jgi:hypothetical protein
MKQQWAPQELIDHWTLTAKEISLVHSFSETDYNQLGYVLMFKCFQREGRFPQRKQDISSVVTEQIAQQLHIPETALNFYNWTGRTIMRHRVHIRQFFGFRIATVKDATEITIWLAGHTLLGEDRQFDPAQGSSLRALP